MNLFHCKDENIFINIKYVCDGERDCYLDSDEKNCPKNNDSRISFYEYNEILNLIGICDYINDYQDNSDENLCRKNRYILSV